MSDEREVMAWDELGEGTRELAQRIHADGYEPDVILAGYSGLTQEDYDTLSEIAPVVAYPEGPWATSWRDMIEINAQGMGMADEGEQLVADLEQEITDTVGAHPQLAGKSATFFPSRRTTRRWLFASALTIWARPIVKEDDTSALPNAPPP